MFLLFVAAVATRLQYVNTTPIYPDEGMVIELAGRLARGDVAGIGALRQGAFAPLASSPLAPWTMALVMRITQLDPLVAVRLWTAILAGLTTLGLVWALWKTRPAPALAALSGLTFACSPLAIDLGRWGFYHHLGALAITLALGLSLRELVAPSARRLTALALVCGLAVVSAYWLLWLALLPTVVVCITRGRRLRSLIVAMAVFAVPLVCLLAWAGMTQGAWLLADATELWSQTQTTESATTLGRIARGFTHAAGSNPWLYLALAGPLLWWAADQEPGGRRAAGVTVMVMALSWLEPLRQRQNMDAIAYPLILVLPIASVGLAAFVVWPLYLQRSWSRVLMAACLASAAGAMLVRTPLSLMHRMAAPLSDVRQLFAELDARVNRQQLVLGTAAVNWRTAWVGSRASDLEQAAAYQGQRTLFIRPGMDKAAFLFVPSMDEASMLIVSEVDRLYTFRQAAPRRLALTAELERWPLVWSNPSFELYGNPRHGHQKGATAGRILRDRALYQLAAFEAFDRSDYDLASLACEQFLVDAIADREGCAGLLDRVKLLGLNPARPVDPAASLTAASVR